jgi:hypothetical protein
MKPEHIEIAEQIARDASCAQGEFNQRVLSIIPYLTDVCDRASLVGVQREDVAQEGLSESTLTAALAGLPDRLDRLFLKASDGERFTLHIDSARNIVEITREWLRNRLSASPASPRAEEVQRPGAPVKSDLPERDVREWIVDYAAVRTVCVILENHGQRSCYYGRLISIEPYVAEKQTGAE